MKKNNPNDKVSILLAEDDIALNETLCDYFFYKNYNIDSFYNGKDAYSSIQKKEYDIIVSDIMMAGGDGLSLLKKVKGNDATKETPFIIISAKATSSDLREGMNLGADDYLFKPFDLISLEKAILRLVNKVERQNKKLASLKTEVSLERKKTEKLEYYSSHIVRKHISNAQGIINLLELEHPNNELINVLKSEVDALNDISYFNIKSTNSIISINKKPDSYLIIDDDEVSLFYTRRMIEIYMKPSYIFTISEPEKVLPHMKENNHGYDLIIIDLNMPVLNGLEVLESLKNENILIPSIILSYNISKLRKNDVEALNVIDVWSKPITENKINLFLKQFE